MHDIESIVEVETILKLLTLCRLIISLWKLHLRNNWINERHPRLNTESSGLPYGLFSILTRFGSLETLLYGPTEGALSLKYIVLPPRNEHPRELYRGYT